MQNVLQDKEWHTKKIEDVASLLEVNINEGLNESEIKLRQTRFGLNIVTPKKQEGPVIRFIKQFSQPLVYILLAASIITAALEEWIDSAVIFGVVLVNSIVGFIQESKAGKAIETLAKMVITEAAVVRSKGKKVRIPSIDIVLGDIVILRSGDKVPADIRLFSARDLRIDESLLTGESIPVDKSSTDVLSPDTVIADRKNMAFAGTMVTYGHGTGIVVATGDHTETGRISENISTVQELITPFSRKLAQFSKFLLYVVLGLAAVTFVFGLIQQQHHPVNLFMASVALAVAAIPEGLPAAVTITLAIGVNRMTKRHSIIRKLPAVETLGSTTVICSDKTGTLTENQMTVKEILAGGIGYHVEGSGYFPKGRFVIMQDKNNKNIRNNVINNSNDKNQYQNKKRLDLVVEDVATHPILKECLIAGMLCNESYLIEKDENWEIKGDPTEGSLIVSARKAGLTEAELSYKMQRIDIIPFESHQQYMATLHTLNKTIIGNDSNNIIYVKGAIEKVLEKCGYIVFEEQKSVNEDKEHYKSSGFSIQKLTEIELEHVLSQARYMAKRGLRVIAFARKETNKSKSTLEISDINTDLTFLGLQGMIDPPRREAIEAVAACRNAGIKVKMITGDNLHTATFIAEQLGLTNNNNHFAAANKDIDNNITDNSVLGKNREDNVTTTYSHIIAVTGYDIENYYSEKRTEEEKESKLAEVVEKTNVFARVSPDQKLSLVRALQSNGHIVAMTGDGVNDAPALKQADIGVAMGVTGTDVAKEASDMILTDDNFASIVAAVEEGRGIFDNLMKFLTWTLPTNFGEGLILLAAIFSGLSLPMLPVQILWINMTTALALGMMLIFEPKEAHIMNRPPRYPSAPIISRTMAYRIVLTSGIILAGVFGLFLWEESNGTSIEEARTVAVNSIVMIELFYLLNCRSLTRSMFSIGLFSNKWILVGIVLMIALQMIYTYLPAMHIIFESSPTSIDSWIRIIVLAVISYLIIESDKWIRRRKIVDI
jgi:Ca2+-transporting ATPase